LQSKGCADALLSTIPTCETSQLANFVSIAAFAGYMDVMRLLAQFVGSEMLMMAN
jgi:hypothetical protein